MADVENCHCQNCIWEGTRDDTDPIYALFERVVPGEPMPSGQCPACGSLCQPGERPGGVQPRGLPGQYLLATSRDGDECPICHSGTLEVVGGEVRCMGECGSVTHALPPGSDRSSVLKVALVGDLSGGFRIYGPYDSSEEAAAIHPGPGVQIMGIAGKCVGPPPSEVNATSSEVGKFLVLSTAHMPNSNPKFGTLRVVEHECGYLLFSSLGYPTPDAPQWLKPILALAVSRGCRYINFDRDAPSVEGLEEWEW